MTLEELKDDIEFRTRKCSFAKEEYIELPTDTTLYDRKSFGSLYNYYKNFEITSIQLLTALIDLKFICRLCPDIEKIVFFKSKYYSEYGQLDGIWMDSIFKEEAKNDFTIDKFDFEYIQTLYNKIINERKIQKETVGVKY